MEFDFDAMIERIKKRKKELGLTNKKLSECSDVPYGTLNKILGSETKEPSINAIIKISEALGLSTEYVIHGKEYKARLEEQAATESVIDDIAINMGASPTHPLSYLTKAKYILIGGAIRVVTDEPTIDPVDTATPYALCLLSPLEAIESHYYFEAKDDQMAPFIENGDYVLVNGDSEIKSGDIAIVAIGERNGVIREVEIDDYEIIIKSRNPYYPPISFTGESREQIHFAGRVERIIRIIK